MPPPPVTMGRKWRRFNRKYGTRILVTCVAAGIMFLVALLLWFLSNPEFRARW